MDRREVVKLLALGSALPALPAEAVELLCAAYRGFRAAPGLKAFTPHQDRTVLALAEMILPETETPGAKTARVNEFIDRIVADWYSDRERERFLAGLRELDARTENRFGSRFVELSPGQKSEVLAELGEELALAASVLGAAPPGYRGRAPEPEEQFYFRFRELTLTGYFTSEAVSKSRPGEELLPGHYDGCSPANAADRSKGSG